MRLYDVTTLTYITYVPTYMYNVCIYIYYVYIYIILYNNNDNLI